MTKITDFEVKNLVDDIESLKPYEGKVLLIVNTASACGFTPQYAELQSLHQEYAAQGLQVLAFPCNQFGEQEKGSNSEIGAFCDSSFHVTFPVMGKIDVNGTNADPLWVELKSRAPGVLGTQAIKWNFTKFLVGRDGEQVTRFASATKPFSMRSQIEALLAS